MCIMYAYGEVTNPLRHRFEWKKSLKYLQKEHTASKKSCTCRLTKSTTNSVKRRISQAMDDVGITVTINRTVVNNSQHYVISKLLGQIQLLYDI